MAVRAKLVIRAQLVLHARHRLSQIQTTTDENPVIVGDHSNNSGTQIGEAVHRVILQYLTGVSMDAMHAVPRSSDKLIVVAFCCRLVQLYNCTVGGSV